MPIQLPNLDDRRYQQLVDEALARIPIHTPEWTNFNQSDPGVTLVQVFAFLTETLIYRCNQIPERNRLKFLQLLGVPLLPAASATGLMTFANERGPLETITLNDDLEVRAGTVPFRTESGLDVLPIEAQVYFKMVRTQPPADQTDARAAYDNDLAHYQQLYEALLDEQAPAGLQMYEPVNLASRGTAGVDVGSETVDQILWIVLLLRSNDNPPSDLLLTQARQAIAGKTLSLGLVPQIGEADAQQHLLPGGDTTTGTASLAVELPSIPASGGLPASRQPSYRPLTSVPVPDKPVVIEIDLPDASQLTVWNNLDPLEPGTNDLPPPLDDTTIEARVITWLRLNWGAGTHAHVQWTGINAAFITQKAHVANEVLTTSAMATGEPDQSYTLANAPVLTDSIVLAVTPDGQPAETWSWIDDLLSAGPEVPTADPRYPPGVIPAAPQPSQVFTIDAESGTIRFGDGFRGARPPLGAKIRVDYDYSQGTAGNVGASAISSAPSLPAGLTVTNPVRTWGGTDSETVDEGEKQVARFLQHRDRLVNTADFEAITLRTPGVQLGRVDVLPAYNPLLSQHEPGNAPGAVTLMLIPKFDALRPDAPQPDGRFIQAVCDYLDPRRLVTTELFLKGPDYQPIFISVGISIVSGRNFSAAVVRQGVIDRLKHFLAPVNPDTAGQLGDPTALLTTPSDAANTNGWPLGRAVLKGELEVEVARVPGVSIVNELLLASTTGDDFDQIAMQGLQLPRVDGIQVSVGNAILISSVRGDTQDGSSPAPPTLVPVPAIPDEC
jgi:hypothetical protein